MEDLARRTKTQGGRLGTHDPIRAAFLFRGKIRLRRKPKCGWRLCWLVAARACTTTLPRRTVNVRPQIRARAALKSCTPQTKSSVSLLKERRPGSSQKTAIIHSQRAWGKEKRVIHKFADTLVQARRSRYCIYLHHIAVKVQQGGVCIKHGAIVKVRRCSHNRCDRQVQQGRICVKHGAIVKVRC